MNRETEAPSERKAAVEQQWPRRTLLLWLAANAVAIQILGAAETIQLPASAAAGPGFRLATFSADVTVPLGHGMMGGAWLSKKIGDPLEAHGLVLLGSEKPIVAVAVDWCEIRNEAYQRWQEVLAAAAGTMPERVLVSTVHQHDAPVADLEAERILRARKLQGTVCDPAFHEIAVQRVAKALRESLATARSVTHLGWGEAQVAQVASNRRYLTAAGEVRFDRMSRTTQPAAIAAPEGLIDPWLKTLSFWNGDTPLAAVSAYATHPMSYYGEGEVSADFPGLARRRRQQEMPGVEQIYLNGAAGNVTAGKYNTGARTNRAVLAERLHEAMAKAWQTTRKFPLTNIVCRFEPVPFEPRNDPGFTPADLEQKLQAGTAPFQQCLAAMGVSWRRRIETSKPITIPCVDFGVVQWVLLPGEAYLEFQLAAQRMRPDSLVLVSGYGDGATGYIPTERHIAEKDGNLNDWCWVAPGSEARLLGAIRRVLAVPEPDAPPWKTNLPIAHVKKELYVRHASPGAAALVSVFQTGAKGERMEVQAAEIRDDVPSEPRARHSTDNGRTWSDFTPLPPTLSHPVGVEVWEGGGAKFYDAATGVLVELWLRQIAIKGLYHNFTYERTSTDHGRTWSPPKQLRYEPGDDFDPRQPLKNSFLQRNHGYFGNNVIRHRNGTLITAVAHANATADKLNDQRPWRMASLCFIGRWDAAAGDYIWTPGQRVEISPELSSRGLMEPEVAALKDGRVLVIWRGSDTPSSPGRKWFGLSSDGGRTLSPPSELRYDDGTRFYSPSSIHRMFRHSVTGKLYWLGNLSATAPRGNAPRYPLVVAEVDESIPALKRATVTAIDDRQPGVSAALQLSNFSLLENPETRELELWLTRYGEDPANVFNADNYKYTCELR
jgi:hypothetical protein